MKNNTLPNERQSRMSPFVRILREGAFPALRLLARPSTLAQIPRLFGEGLAPARRMFVQAHNNREMARLLREQAPVTFVCSFARSGNTWMRYLVCDVLLQNQGVQTTTELPVEPGNIIPDYYADLIARRNSLVETPCHLIKTHDLIPLVQKHVGGDPAVLKCRYLYLFRTPEDSLVSFFHLYLREKFIRSKAGRDIDLFCLEALPGWLLHMTSYLDALDEGVEVHLVSYDQLLRQPSAVLSETLRWLGIPHTEAAVAHANSNMKFSNLKAMEAKTLGDRVPFFRRGSDGSGSLELKAETLAIIRDATRNVVARANVSLARQESGSGTVRERPSPPPFDKANCHNGRAEVISAGHGR
jgi:hypothetical protein